jgi:hypothetical protein
MKITWISEPTIYTEQDKLKFNTLRAVAKEQRLVTLNRAQRRAEITKDKK